MNKFKTIYSDIATNNEEHLSSNESRKRSYVILIAVIVISVVNFVSAITIIKSSTFSENIDIESCYSELIVMGIILLVFIKMYRIRPCISKKAPFN